MTDSKPAPVYLYKCPYCKALFEDRLSACEHIRVRHPKREAPTFSSNKAPAPPKPGLFDPY